MAAATSHGGAPKVFLLFLALLPQFAVPSATVPVGIQVIVLGTLHVADCAPAYYAVGYGASAVLIKRSRAAEAVGIVSGAVMIALGIVLILEKVLVAVH